MGDVKNTDTIKFGDTDVRIIGWAVLTDTDAHRFATQGEAEEFARANGDLPIFPIV
jgi:hypothetical protein